MQYTVVKGDSINELARAVNEEIQRGYEPQGGVAVATNETTYYVYYQAMVKR